MACSWIILNLILRLTHPLQSSVTFISDVWLFRDLWWRILSLPRNKSLVEILVFSLQLERNHYWFCSWSGRLRFHAFQSSPASRKILQWFLRPGTLPPQSADCLDALDNCRIGQLIRNSTYPVNRFAMDFPRHLQMQRKYCTTAFFVSCPSCNQSSDGNGCTIVRSPLCKFLEHVSFTAILSDLILPDDVATFSRILSPVPRDIYWQCLW